MTDKKFTDEEVIKALECCAKPYCNNNNCPLHENTINTKDCITKLSENALDLINRQREEMGDLKVEFDAMRGAANSYKMHYKEAQAEIAKLHKAMEEIGVTAKEIKKELPLLEAEIRANAVKGFAQRVKAHTRHLFSGVDMGHIVDELVMQETEERTE